MNDIKSLSYLKWGCKYHIVFSQKFRRLEVYGEIKADIEAILRKLYEREKWK